MTICNMSQDVMVCMSQKPALKIDCLECGSKEAYVYNEKRYRGLRGFCPICETNWPES